MYLDMININNMLAVYPIEPSPHSHVHDINESRKHGFVS